MNIKKWATSFTALLCLLCLTVGLFAGCNSVDSKVEVVFDMNWKEAPSTPESIEVTEGKPYGQLPQIADNLREGYTFGGWYLDSDCDGEEVTAETVVESSVDHVLYAKWIGKEVTVSFDLQGGTINGVSNVEDVVVKVGNVYSMMAIPEDPDKENSSFMGWYYDPEGKEGPVRTSTKVEKTEDHTLYAVWQEYKLFYDFEDGTGLELFAAAGNIQYGIEQYNGSNQLNIANPGTDKADGTALQMWIPLKAGTRVTMDLTFAGELPTQDARMYMFAYGLNASGIAITDGIIDIKESETHRKWYHGNGYRAMQKGGTWYYGDEGNWQEGNTCKFEMIVMEDCAGLYLMFCLGDKLEPAQFAQNDIYIDNIEFTPNYYRSLGEGMMGSSPYGATDKGIYFTMKKNDMPYDSDWKVYYDATSANNVKVIRNGKVYRIAQTDCDNIVKFSETDYYLRLEEYTIGAAAPISKKDIFIVEGNFRYGKNTLTIKKTYIYYDGVSWVCADYLPEELAPASEKTYDLPDPYAGILRPHEGGATDSGIHFKLSDNGLPFNADWSVYYDATSADNVKIIRDGKVYRAAQVGCDNICKFGKADYYLRLENYTIGGYWPFTTEDIFIVEGEFQYEDSILDINKTYIYHDGSDWVFATKLPAELAPETEEPVEPEEIADGVMGSSPNGATDQGIYFTMQDNGLPYGDWSVYYDATSADNVKIIRDGVTYPAAQVGCDNICKFTATDYYLKLENYTIGSYAPFSTADIFVVEGDFTYEESTLTIVKTYIYHNGTSWVFAAELPEDLQPGEGGGEELGSNLGVLSAHTAGVAKDAGDNITGIYATGAATNAPFNTDWSVEYTPAAAGNYQLIRDGVTYDVGVTGNGTLVLFGQTELYLKQEGHTFGDGTLLPIRDGDVLVVKGEWICNQDASAKVTIDTTYILIGEGAVTFSATEPDVGGGEEEKNYNLGVLSANAGGVSTNGDGNINGIYATGTAVDAPCNGDWSVEYAPAAAENYKLIRGGVSYNVGIPGQGTFVLINQTDLYLKQEAWTVSGELLPLQNGDILVVEGQWTCTSDASAKVTIETTYILIGEGAVTFSATEPDVGGGEEEKNYNLGVLSANTGGVSTNGDGNINGIYATGTAVDAPCNGDWSVEYAPAAAENYKLIRGGVSYNVGIPGQGTFVLINQTDLYLKQEAWTVSGELLPLQNGDILVVEGQWTCTSDASAAVTIEKTYILIGEGAVTFSATEPDVGGGEGEELADGVMGSSPNGATDQGIYFTMKDNGLPYGDWSVYYDATSADNVKIIRDGVTYPAAQVGCDNICKFTATDYYLKLENYTIGSYAPFSTADIFVVEGDFTYEDSTLTIVKTYIYHNGTSWVFAAELPEDLQPGEGGEGEVAGLSAHTAGVNIDTTTNSIKGIYAVCADNSATFNSDWSVEYTPAAAENYKLIRDGVTYNVGVPGNGTIVLFGQTELYLKQEGHVFGDGTLLPIQNGDILVVEGQWNCIQDASSTLTIDKTYILISEGTATFSATEPDVGGGEGEAAGLSAHTAGVNIDTTTNSIKGIYAVCADNSATFNSDWSVEYTPTAAENYKLIRDGVTYNVGVTGQGTLVLFGQTELYLKQEGHTFGDGTLLPIKNGDVLVVEGQWNCIQDASSSLTIDTTYIIVSDNTVTFAAELPESTLPEEDEVQLSFNFDDGTVSEDVFKLRDSDLTMTVEELNGSNQLRLKPTVKNGTYWLWLDQDLKAGTVITMDVTFNRKLGTKAMSLYLYGAKENGDPITEGTVSGTVPQTWFDGQGVEGDFTNGKVNTQTVTFTVYEDCHGIACMTSYGDQTTNLIYLDNIVKQSSSEEE